MKSAILLPSEHKLVQSQQYEPSKRRELYSKLTIKTPERSH